MGVGWRGYGRVTSGPKETAVTRTGASQAKQDEIARAAASLFNAKGFHQTSMDDVAAAIGVKKPTLYHYVRSKAQIVAWIHDECVQAVLPALRRHLASDMPRQDVLFQVASDIFGLLEAKPGYLRVYFEHHRELASRDRTRARKQRNEYFSLVRQILDEGVRRGEFQIENTELTAMAFFGMCNWAYQWYQPDGSMSADEIAHYLWRGFLRGVLTSEHMRLAAGSG